LGSSLRRSPLCGIRRAQISHASCSHDAVKVNPADMDKALANPNSPASDILRGTRIRELYPGSSGRYVLGLHYRPWPWRTALSRTFRTPLPQPSQSTDLGATNIQCRCFTVIACETFDHFHQILRKRKGMHAHGDRRVCLLHLRSQRHPIHSPVYIGFAVRVS